MDDNSSFDTVITASSGWFDINLRELWRYRDLVYLFVRRNFVAAYKQTILGPAWAIVQPLLTTIVFTVVFGRLAKLPTDGIPHFLYYMTGNLAWGYFSGCLSTTANTFVGNAGMMGKVYFPRLVMPISSVFSQLISFGIQFLLLSGFLVYYSWLNSTVYLTWRIVLLPIIMLQMAMLGLGFGIIISAVTTRYRDLFMLVGFGLQLWMYATPVVYSVNMVPQRMRFAYMFNPMVAVLDSFRSIFFSKKTVTSWEIILSWALTIIVLMVGLMIFSKVEKTFIDTV